MNGSFRGVGEREPETLGRRKKLGSLPDQEGNLAGLIENRK